MSIKDIIAKSKQKKFLGEGDVAIRSFIDSKVSEMTDKILNELTPQIKEEATRIVESEIKDLKSLKKSTSFL